MWRLILPAIIACLPSNRLRVALYRALCGYRISAGSRVGPFTLLCCTTAELRDARIGPANFIIADALVMEPGSVIGYLNKILHVKEVRLGSGAYVQSKNNIVGTRNPGGPFKEFERFSLGAKSIITRRHAFDVSDTVTIGANVTFGGWGSTVWTHGFDMYHIKVQAPVTLGDDIYIGSNTLIVQGVRIASRVSVGCGTVVSTSIAEPGFYVSSQLLRKGDPPDYSRHEGLKEFEGGRYVRKQ